MTAPSGVFESLTKPAVWVNATRPDDNKFYDIGFEVEKKGAEVEALQRQLAEMVAARDADKEKAGTKKKRSKKVKLSKVAGNKGRDMLRAGDV